MSTEVKEGEGESEKKTEESGIEESHQHGADSSTAGKNVTYDEKGDAFYTDETTKTKLKWCKITNQWKPYENEHYRWCDETQKWVSKVALENEYYRWCDKTNQWIPKMSKDADGGSESYGYDEKEGCHTYTDKDGIIFVFDKEKKAWFPRVDDDFLAVYQMNYGFVDNTSTAVSSSKDDQSDAGPHDTQLQPETSNVDAQDTSGAQKRKAPPPPSWFDVEADQNTKVYVSNLPLDITEDEFAETMSKCGMIMKDIKTGKLKIKLYRDANKKVKGDGLCHYIRVESVELALKVLDESDVRGKQIKVQRAQFEMKGEYNPALKPKTRKTDKQKIKKMQEKLFDWRPDKMRGERGKHERTVVLKNLFTPELFDQEVQLIIDYQNELREECGKCGTVRKVVVYDRHPEGIAQVSMLDPEEADLLIKLMHGRMFGDRKITAETWDGKTKFKVDENETERTERLANWDDFLKDDEEDGKKEEQVEKESVMQEPSNVNVDEVPTADEAATEK